MPLLVLPPLPPSHPTCIRHHIRSYDFACTGWPPCSCTRLAPYVFDESRSSESLRSRFLPFLVSLFISFSWGWSVVEDDRSRFCQCTEAAGTSDLVFRTPGITEQLFFPQFVSLHLNTIIIQKFFTDNPPPTIYPLPFIIANHFHHHIPYPGDASFGDDDNHNSAYM